MNTDDLGEKYTDGLDENTDDLDENTDDQVHSSVEIKPLMEE